MNVLNITDDNVGFVGSTQSVHNIWNDSLEFTDEKNVRNKIILKLLLLSTSEV